MFHDPFFSIWLGLALNCLVYGKYGLCEKNELGNSTKCPENSHSCVYSSCTDSEGTNFIIRNCGAHTKIENEDVCIQGHGQSVS